VSKSCATLHLQAVINTVLANVGLKKPAGFKATQKEGGFSGGRLAQVKAIVTISLERASNSMRQFTLVSVPSRYACDKRARQPLPCLDRHNKTAAAHSALIAL
jgi:hypothetical protein